MSRIRFGVWAVMALILAPLAGAQSYTVTDLGTLPGGNSSFPTGINSNGAVTGYASVGSQSHAFLWTAAAGIQDLGVLSGDLASWGQAINDSGEIVGGSYSVAGTFRAFRWTKAGGMQDLGVGVENGFALGVNNAGQIVGYTDFVGGTVSAFLWTTSSGGQNLGTLGGSTSTAYGINDSGEVVGYSTLAGDNTDHAFVWTQSGGMQDIDTLVGNTSTIAYGINASGIIAGLALTSSGSQNAAIEWSPAHKMRILGAGKQSAGLAINASGEIVGQTGKPTNALLWTQAAGEQNLNSLIPQNSGWILTSAQGINRVGQIAATGTINGETHAALLTPTN